MRSLAAILACMSCIAAGCAQGETPVDTRRPVQFVAVDFDQHTVVRSSVLRFRLLGTGDRQATIGQVHFSGSLGEGRELDETYFVPVDRIGERGDLVLEVRVSDALWEVVSPDPQRTLSGRIDVSVEDEIGVFAAGEVDGLALRFEAEYPPRVDPVEDRQVVYPDQRIGIKGEGFLRPEEGTTWAVVDSGAVRFGEDATRPVTNARVAVEWAGSRTQAVLPISPTVFGVRTGEFSGNLRFENELDTGEVFEGSTQDTIRASLRPPRIEGISPDRGSRGQKITVSGRGFVADTPDTDAGTYFVLNGVLEPSSGGVPLVFDNDEVILTPFRVVDETTVEQEVSYSV
ncbi:MAG: hypothetical protein R3324_07045, partial [Halobacteriales archaeon]|nr:hypothetical protein [Halobacteriales archaeon]